jgi:hypothetical protein
MSDLDHLTMNPKDMIIKADPIKVNISPYGFFHNGKEFFDTAKTFNQTAHFSPIPYYLFCHAIELLLKAFLLANGISKKDLPKRDIYGHNLEKILKKANELGLGKFVTIIPEQKREIEKASKESCPVRPIPAYKAGLYGLTETRQLSNSNTKPAFIPVHRTGFSASFNKYYTSTGFEYFYVIRTIRLYPELPDLSVLEQVASVLSTQLEAVCLNAD